MKQLIFIVIGIIITTTLVLYFVSGDIMVDNLQLIDIHKNISEENHFSTFSGFKILDDSSILIILNNSNNNAYFTGGNQTSKIDPFVIEKKYKIDDMFILGATQHKNDGILQLFKLDSINFENQTVTFTHYVSHVPITDSLKQFDYVGKKVIFKNDS